MSIIALFIIILIVIVVPFFFYFIPVGLWISSWAAGVKVSIITLIGMRLRRVPPSAIVQPMIKSHKA